ncbi:MAG: hypothetical protein EX285_06075 [Thaumarchaeota archaeon]|nr:hypothetical protein [Nitrososphaerota archaeon]
MISVADFEWKESLDDDDKNVEINILLDRIAKRIQHVYYDLTARRNGAHLGIDLVTDKTTDEDEEDFEEERPKGKSCR